MTIEKYSLLWFAFLNIKAEKGKKFNDLIDLESDSSKQFKGAWANIIVKGNNISEALEILPKGLKELGFEIIFIEKIQHFASLVENNEINKEVIREADWLNKSKFVFKISDSIFPYQ